MKEIEYYIRVNKIGFDDFVKIFAHYQPFSPLPITNSYCKSGVFPKGSKYASVHNVLKKDTHEQIGNLIIQFGNFIFDFDFHQKGRRIEGVKIHIDGD